MQILPVEAAALSAEKAEEVVVARWEEHAEEQEDSVMEDSIM